MCIGSLQNQFLTRCWRELGKQSFPNLLVDSFSMLHGNNQTLILIITLEVLKCFKCFRCLKRYDKKLSSERSEEVLAIGAMAKS